MTFSLQLKSAGLLYCPNRRNERIFGCREAPPFMLGSFLNGAV